jgi:hypothetical protein
MLYFNKQLQSKNTIEQTSKLYLQILTIAVYSFKKDSRSV